MTFQIIVSSAVAGAIVSLIGSIITAKIAQNTARETAKETANQEIKKLEKTWEREDIISSEEEFAAMADAVARCIHRNTVDNGVDAAGKVAGIRSKERGALGEILDDLHKSITDRDLPKAGKELSKAIDEKRRIRGYEIKEQESPNKCP